MRVTQSTPELRPCPNPWCERNGPPAAIPEGSSAKPWNVICVSCGFIGPAASSEAKAATAWNTRSTPDRNAVLAEAANTCVRLAMEGDAYERECAGGRSWFNIKGDGQREAAAAIRALTTTPEPTDPAGVSEREDAVPHPMARCIHCGQMHVEHDRVGNAYICAGPTGVHFQAALRTPPVLEVAGLFEAIQHGDADHRAWLKEAITAYAAGKPVPEPRGKGRKEAVLEVVKEALEEALERAVMVCPQCEGEGGYPDGLDDAACHTECTRCEGNGWIVDVASLRVGPAGEARDRITRIIMDHVVDGMPETPEETADAILACLRPSPLPMMSEMAEELDRAADRLSRSTIAPNPMIRDVIQTLRSGRDALRTPPVLEVVKEALERVKANSAESLCLNCQQNAADTSAALQTINERGNA